MERGGCWSGVAPRTHDQYQNAMIEFQQDDFMSKRDNFALDDRRCRADQKSVVGDFLKALGPFVAAASVDSDVLMGEVKSTR
jgi:hypothetical protein